MTAAFLHKLFLKDDLILNMKYEILLKPVDAGFILLQRKLIPVVVVEFYPGYNIAILYEEKLHPVDGACPAAGISEKAEDIISQDDLADIA
jgi:hypothetical protein